jgi:fructosamine-3-kinase
MSISLILQDHSATLSIKSVSTLDQSIEEAISRSTSEAFSIRGSTGLGGGCIHDASCVTGSDGRRFFVKRNSIGLLPSFEAEAHSLKRLADTGTIRVPAPVCTCHGDGQCALVLEYLPMGGRLQDWSAMGTQLAQLHRHGTGRYGWDHDNWIGSFPQINTWHDEWVEFFAQCRLRPQADAANRRGLRLTQMDALIEALPAFFDGYDPPPSLLHGDLWSGNASFLEDGTPLVYDPASYYGDRETDLAMTEMFGGFPREFYDTYDREWPLDKGYRIRKQLYILYHTLNHYNLFGGGYGSQAESIIAGLLRHA